MKTGCSKHSVTHGESFSFLRIFNQSRQNRANKAWGVCFGGRGFSLAPVLLQFCVRWDKPTTPLDFRLYSLLNNKCFLPPLPCRGLRGSGKSSQLPFPTSDPTGNFLPSLTSAFHSPGPGGTRCHCLVTEEAQWCKPDHPSSSFDTPMASQPTKSQVISTASLLSSFLSEYMLLKSPANEKCSFPPGRTPQDPGSHQPSWVQCWGEVQNGLPCTMKWYFPHKFTCLICQSLPYFYSLRTSSSQWQMLCKQIFLYESHRTFSCMAQEMKP